MSRSFRDEHVTRGYPAWNAVQKEGTFFGERTKIARRA